MTLSEPEPATNGKTARNERIKLTATWFNGAAIAAVAVGFFAPVTGYLTGAVQAPLWSLNLMVTGWLLASMSLHFAGRIVLRRIED